MSLKENIDFVKKEISSEEKFLEGFVRAESFFKKYKKLIIVSVTVAVVAVIGLSVNSFISENNKIEANIAFNKILKNPNDKEALSVLESKNKNLHQLALYLKTTNEGKIAQTEVKYLKELSIYKKAIENKNVSLLNSVSMKSDFLLKEYALFNKALIQAENKKFDDAKNTLKLINADSKVNDLVVLLNHYLLSK